MDNEYEIQVSIPVDSDGFLRRECPHCVRQFKWHDGPANEESEHHARPASYSCPMCGQPGADDSWNTPEQLDLIEKAAMPLALGIVEDELEAMFRGMKGIDYKRSNEEPADFADPLVESDDMTIVTSPCHDYEPVKVPEDHGGPLYCLICGSAFAV